MSEATITIVVRWLIGLVIVGLVAGLCVFAALTDEPVVTVGDRANDLCADHKGTQNMVYSTYKWNIICRDGTVKRLTKW